MLLYRYKGTKKSRKNRIFSMKNVTISDIIFTLVLRSNPTVWKCLENACFYCIFALHLEKHCEHKIIYTTQKLDKT